MYGTYSVIEINNMPVLLKHPKALHPTHENKHIVIDAEIQGREYLDNWLKENAPIEIQAMFEKYIDLITLIHYEEDDYLTEKGIKDLVKMANEVLQLTV